MNDLDLLRTLRAEPPGRSQDALADARSRLLDRATGGLRRGRRRQRAGWPTAAVAVATLAVILGVRAIVTAAGGPPDRAEGPQPDTVQSLLARAAQTVAREAPAAQATKGQYWYIKQVVQAIRPDLGTDEDDVTIEYWYQAGSKRPGKLGRVRLDYETGHVTDVQYRNGEAVITENGQVVDHRTLPVRAFKDDPQDPASWWLPDDVAATAPTNATEMVAFIRDQSSPTFDYGLLFGMLFQPILTQQQRAAAYEALGRWAADIADVNVSLAPDV